jgi:hypothetical protein
MLRRPVPFRRAGARRVLPGSGVGAQRIEASPGAVCLLEGGAMVGMRVEPLPERLALFPVERATVDPGDPFRCAALDLPAVVFHAVIHGSTPLAAFPR